MASQMRFEAAEFPVERTRRKPGDAADCADDRLAAFQVRVDVEYERSLSKLIEGEVIPRLLAAHSPPVPVALHEVGDGTISAADVEAFAPLSLQVEADELLDHVEGLRCRGISVDTLLVDLLAPAARLLGEFWEDDRCDFVDVTMGLWRMQEVVHELSAATPAHRRPEQERSALFASMPGDQHSFGTVVVDELFAREGWQTERMSETETADLLDRVRADWFDLVGLTISCDCHIARLPSMIQSLRGVSRNPRVRVMVGGRVFIEDADLAVRVGADGTAPDAKLAVKVAGELVAQVDWEAVL